MFNLKEPCKDCPFLVGNDYLSEERMKEIVLALHENHIFHCHKTLDYSKPESKRVTSYSQYCAGAMVYLEKCGNTNVPMRLGMLMNAYDGNKLKGHNDVIDALPISKSPELWGREYAARRNKTY